MKKLMALLLALLIPAAASAGVLPKTADLFAVEMPSFAAVLGRGPDEEKTLQDSTLCMLYRGVADGDVDAFSEYLEEWGCELKEFEAQGAVLTALIEKNGRSFTLVYDREASTAELLYPEGTRCEVPADSGRRTEETDEKSAELEAFRTVGGMVTFGRCEQDGDHENGPEPIEWIVLETEGDRSLLLSRYGLDTVQYNDQYISSLQETTWEKCSLRTWLNDDFLNASFFAAEREAILPTEVDNGSSQGNGGWNTDGGNDTLDRIFLISYAEALKYFETDSARQCAATWYAIAATEYGASIDRDTGNCLWWLRSPGRDQRSAACVDSSGSFTGSYGAWDQSAAVRPALWVDLGRLRFDAPGAEVYRSEEQFRMPGCTVVFGTYVQSEDPDGEAEPIEWIVLDTDGDRSLLVSKYAIETMPFNAGSSDDITWKDCTLRKWLNEEFLNAAFSAAERKAVLKTGVDNSDVQGYSGWDTHGGSDTLDRVFLLSYTEAWEYLDHGTARQCLPTAHAKAQGAHVSGYQGACWWWLRSPGKYQYYTAYVSSDGSPANDFFTEEVDCSPSGGFAMQDSVAVRPALWIDLGALSF